MDMVTINWTIKKGFGASAVNAVGRVRWWLPKVLGDSGAVYGRPEPGAWLDLVNGSGSIEIPDPRSETVNPRYWAPMVEIESDAWDARPYPVAIPEEGDGPFTLDELIPLAVRTTGVMNLRGPAGPAGATGAQGPAGAPGAPGVPGDTGPAGSAGPQGPEGPAGPAGADGEDGTLKAYASTGMVTGTFGPAGDSGTWTLCPAQYRVSVAAEAGDRLLWVPGFLHQNNAEAAYDVASVVSGVAARYRSSGGAVPAAAGYGGLYVAAGWPRGMAPVWWTVAAEDLVAGVVTLALAYRDTGAGNTLGHASVAGDVVLTNHGQGV